ncbi:MAG TPA: glycosyltransferase family 9 protein [Actinomycetospora sp.]|uniref:glycosyltransferase family 9 protein n=1 Tax=Actinomycetospora sp. TaxID=1872135 RepID=UPI002F3FD4C6
MRTLVVDLLGGLGDLVMVLPSLHALRDADPDGELVVLTHAPGAVLLERDPAVSAVRLAQPHAERAAVEAALAELAPDLVVTTTRFDGIGDVVDDDAAARGTRAVSNLWRSPPPDELVGERYQRILATEGVISLPVRPPRVVLGDDERAAGRAATASLPGGTVLLVPGAGMAVKRWPVSRWSALARALAAEGRGVAVVGDEPIDGVMTLPPTDLRGLAARFAALGERGGVVVGGDTGPVRVAAAVGAPTAALFGPTLAVRYGLEDGRNLQGYPACPHRRPTAITEQVCWWDAGCPLSATGPACLEDLPVADVAAAVRAATPTARVEIG